MKKENRIVFLRMFAFLKPYIKHYLFIALLITITTVIGFFQPLIIQTLTDKGLVQKNMDVILVTSGILTILVTADQFASIYQTSLFVDIHNSYYLSLFKQVIEKLLNIKLDYFMNRNSSEIQSVLQTDVSQVSSITDIYITSTLGNVFKIISGLAGLTVISWQLTILIIAIVPIKICVVRYCSKKQEKQTENYIEQSRTMAQWIGDTISGITEIKLCGLSKEKQDFFLHRQRSLLQKEKQITMLSEWNLFGEAMIEWVANILIYITGGLMICSNKLSLGAVFAFISYSWYVTGPVSSLLNLKMYFARILPSARRLFTFLDMETEEDIGAKRIDSSPPCFEFKDVSFSYQPGRNILRGVSFRVEPGEKVAIIGQNGSGKSTILNLLLRFYTPDSGEITADGVSISQLSLDEYRALFSVVSQEPYLFLGDVSSNVDLTGQAAPDRVAAAMETSGVEDYLRRMPDGAKTQIGRNGARLSGGEKQKLAVARALVKDAPVVILDEATSGFDVESDVYLHDVIVNQMAGKSVILITHRYENLEGMDRIYKLEHGQIFESEV